MMFGVLQLFSNRYAHLSIIAFVCFIGISLRIAVLISNPSHPNYLHHPYTDEVHYRQLAENLIDFKSFSAYSQGFFSVSTRPPLYSTVLSIVTFLTNGSPRAHHYLNLFLEILNFGLVYLLALILFNRSCAIAALMIYALTGANFTYLKFSTSEILVVSLLLSSILYLVVYKRSGSPLSLLSFALCYALLLHGRPAFLLMIPFLPLIMHRKKLTRNWYKESRKHIAVTLFIVLLCVPWGIRNYRHHGTIVPVCTIAGWHVGAHARKLTELPIELLWEYIYNPVKKEYSEGDYYREATQESIQLMLSSPFETSISGMVRIIYAWGFSQPIIRIFLPRSYIYPVSLSPSFFLPMIDFEGVVYLSFIGLIACVRLKKRRAKLGIRAWWGNVSVIIIFLSIYVVVHSLSIPMIQYRFIIEPVIMILLLGLFFSIFDPINGNKKWGRRIGSLIGVPMSCFCLVFLVFLGLYTCVYGDQMKKSSNYQDSNVFQGMQNSPLSVDYLGLREIQWQNRGNLPMPVRATVIGVVKYMASGYRFPNDQIPALAHSGTVAKLFVRKFDPQRPLGIGDLKLNFLGPISSIRNGQRILVTGVASVDPFKEIIIDVDHYRILQ